MPDPITGSLILGVGSSLMSNSAQNSAAEEAARGQNEAEAGGIAARKAMFDISTGLLKPYADAGIPAVQAMQGIIGGDTNNPEYQALMNQALRGLSDTSVATGGTRGGNTAGILGNYSPLLMKQLTDQRFARLGGVAGTGAKSALGLGGSAVDLSGQQIQSAANQGQVSQNLSLVQDQLAQQNMNLLPRVLGTYLGNRPASGGVDADLNASLKANPTIF